MYKWDTLPSTTSPSVVSFSSFLMTPGGSAPFGAGWELGSTSSRGACLSLASPPFPMCSVFSGVYFSQTWGMCPRDLVPSVVLAHGLLRSWGQGGWDPAGTGCSRAGRLRVPGCPPAAEKPWGRRAAPRAVLAACPSCGPYGVMLCLYILYRGLSFPFVNYI